MPVHDWTLVEAGIFHSLHVIWVGALQRRLNAGLLPEGYYALTEQHAGRAIADVLTLHAPTGWPAPVPPAPVTGGTTLTDAPPRVRRKQTVEPAALNRRRSVAVRHVSGHRLVALIEIVSPSNKDRQRHVATFAAKAVDALDAGVHFLLVDLFPPGLHDPHGLHEVIFQSLGQSDQLYDLPAAEPLTLASYVADDGVDVYLEHVAVGATLPDMPLFFRPDRYISVPLESTYDDAFEAMPEFWRNVLEGR